MLISHRYAGEFKTPSNQMPLGPSNSSWANIALALAFRNRALNMSLEPVMGMVSVANMPALQTEGWELGKTTNLWIGALLWSIGTWYTYNLQADGTSGKVRATLWAAQASVDT